MNSPKRIKFIIGLAIIIVVALLTVIVFQIVNITKAKKEIAKQQDQIRELNEKLDYYQNKTNISPFNILTIGDN